MNKLLNWIRYLFLKSADVVSRVRSPRKDLIRVKSKKDKDSLGEPRWYTIYYLMGLKRDIAVCHWQGWEDAGYKLIPTADLELPDTPIPSVTNVPTYFYVLPEGMTCHTYDGKTNYRKARVNYFYKNKLGELLAYVNETETIKAERLYGVDDPQYFKQIG